MGALLSSGYAVIWLLLTPPRIRFSDLLGKYGATLSSNQVEFGLLRKLPETSGLVAEAKKRNIAILACAFLSRRPFW